MHSVAQIAPRFGAAGREILEHTATSLRLRDDRFAIVVELVKQQRADLRVAGR